MMGCERIPRHHSWTPASENTGNHAECTRIALKEISSRSTKNIVVSRADLQSRATRRHSICESSTLDGLPRKNRLRSIFPEIIEIPNEQSKKDSVSSPRACSLPMHESNCVGGARASEHLRNVSEWFRDRQINFMENEIIGWESMFDVIGKAGEDFRSFVLHDANHPECS